MKETNLDKKEDEKPIDEILYLIKEKKFDEDTIKKDLKIDVKVKIKYSENYGCIEYDGKKYDIEKKSRMITFIDEEKSINTKKFIYSRYNLKEVIDKLEFKSLNISENDEDSLGSQINEKEILKIFENESIIKIKKDKPELEKLKDKFKGRYSERREYISDISLNSSSYFPENKEIAINFTIFETFKSKLDIFFVSNGNILYITGPKGTSKSLFLMDYCYTLNEFHNIPLLYINYKYMKELTIEKKKNIFKKEFLYLFFEENALINFYNQKAYETIKTEKFLKFIYDFTVYLLNIYKNTFNNKILLVIDNFDEDDESEIIILQKLIKLVNKEENRLKIRLILAGRCNFIYEKQFLYLKNELDIETSNKLELFLYYNIQLNEPNELNKSDMNSLPLFFFNQKIQDNEEAKKLMLIDEEKKFCNKFNAYGMHYSILNEGKEIKLTELENYYELLPIDYLIFTKIDNNFISFKFHNEIFKCAAKKSIEFSIQNDHFTYILKGFDNNRITFGIFEEKILTLYLSYSKLSLEDLFFEKNNRLEVDEIFQFQNNIYNRTQKKFNSKKPIIITQENYMGQYYDLLILTPNISFNSYKAFFIQIGTNKTKSQIDLIKNDLNTNETSYKKGIKKFIARNISKVELVFIFDEETQIGLINNNDASGAKYCLKNKILFYIFSIEDFKLYSTDDMNQFILIEKFEDTPITGRIKRTYNDLKGNFSFLKINEIQLINNKIGDDILSNYSIIKGKSKIGDLNKYDKNSIYIFFHKNERIYIINQIYYQLENKILKNVDKDDIDQDKFYQLRILEKISSDTSGSKIFKKHKKK